VLKIFVFDGVEMHFLVFDAAIADARLPGGGEHEPDQLRAVACARQNLREDRAKRGTVEGTPTRVGTRNEGTDDSHRQLPLCEKKIEVRDSDVSLRSPLARILSAVSTPSGSTVTRWRQEQARAPLPWA
jgi:hypothetical protein